MATYKGRPIKDLVPPDKRNRLKYEEKLLELQNGLTTSESIDIYCAHEAGHLIFWKRSGFSRFEFHGPTLTYDLGKTDEGDKYGCYFAAVQTPEIHDVEHYSDALLDLIARGAAAGDIFNDVRQQIAPRPFDKNPDYQDLKKLCYEAYTKDQSLGFDPVTRWLKAFPEVQAYLADQNNEPEIQSAIMTVRRECFHLP